MSPTSSLKRGWGWDYLPHHGRRNSTVSTRRDVPRAYSLSGWGVISKTDLRSRALPRSDQVSDRASRLNYNTIEDRVEDDTNDRCSRSIRELKDEAQSAMER